MPTRHTLTLVACLTVLVFFTARERGESVSAVANRAIVEGVVTEYAILSSHLAGIQPQQVLYRLTVKIESTGNIEGSPNFFHDRNGQEIGFYSKDKLDHELFGKRIRGTAELRGDERGRVCWISEIVQIK